MNAATQIQTPQIGELIEGGYFTGVINLNGVPHGIVVAPASANLSRGEWGAVGTKIAATSHVDGLANTQAMAEAGSGIAQQAQALDVNGFTDWYIPARNEAELIYRHLKPTEQANWNGYLDGYNPDSVPPGDIYENEPPAQTTIDLFREGAAEAMEAGFYWTSTQSSAHTAFIQAFSDGVQGTNHKFDTLRVRAVRRFKLAN